MSDHTHGGQPCDPSEEAAVAQRASAEAGEEPQPVTVAGLDPSAFWPVDFEHHDG